MQKCSFHLPQVPCILCSVALRLSIRTGTTQTLALHLPLHCIMQVAEAHVTAGQSQSQASYICHGRNFRLIFASAPSCACMGFKITFPISTICVGEALDASPCGVETAWHWSKAALTFLRPWCVADVMSAAEMLAFHNATVLAFEAASLDAGATSEGIQIINNTSHANLY